MSVIAYPFRIIDDAGALVAGATIAVGATTLVAGTPASVNVKNLADLSALNGVSVTYHNAGNGDYVLLYDPEASGEAYIPLAVSKAGFTITGTNALQAIIATRDSSRIQQGINGAGKVSPIAQELRDAMKLAPSAGAAAAGSVDAMVDQIEGYTDAVEGVVNSIATSVTTIAGYTDTLETAVGALPTASAIVTALKADTKFKIFLQFLAGKWSKTATLLTVYNDDNTTLATAPIVTTSGEVTSCGPFTLA